MPTLLDYVAECAAALDDFEQHTLASSAATTGTAATLVNVTTNISTSRYDDRFVYVTSGAGVGQQRRVRPGGYDPTTGKLTIYPDWTSPGAVAVYLTGLWGISPVGAPGEGSSYTRLINQTLALIDREDALSLAVAATTTDYALTTWKDWLVADRILRVPARRPDGSVVRVLDVREPAPVASMPAVLNPVRGWECVDDGELPKLRTLAPFTASSGSLEIHVRRPSDTWIAVGGAWAESTVGLSATTDQALVPVRDLIPVFLMLAYRTLMNRQPGSPSDPTIMKKYLDARDEARTVPGYNRMGEPSPPAGLQEAA